MKTPFSFLLVIFLSLQTKAETAYKLTEAIQKNLVTVSMSGAKSDTSFHGDYSTHYGSCMAMEIVSTTSENLNLNLEYGYRLVPDDSSLQTMMVTQSLIVKLQPRQKKNYRVYAMCTEAHDGGPGPEEKFVLRNRATGNLLGLAELINRKKYQNDAAQNAVWCLTNDYELSSIYSEDTVMMYDLRRFVAKAKGLSLAKIYASSDGSYSPPERIVAMRTIYSGSLSYSFSRTSKVMIALFDEDNHMKKVYVNNETQRDGEYTYNYQIGSDEMDNKKHYLRMFRDGKLEEEISIIPRE
jgi:hypothetical protein